MEAMLPPGTELEPGESYVLLAYLDINDESNVAVHSLVGYHGSLLDATDEEWRGLGEQAGYSYRLLRFTEEEEAEST